MFRVFASFGIVAAIIAGVIGWAFHVSGPLPWLLAFLILGCYLVFGRHRGPRLVVPSAAWRCPYCRKGVKAGATICHHCQRSLTPE